MTYYIYSPDSDDFIKTVKVLLVDEELEYISIEKLNSINPLERPHLIVTASLDEIKRVLIFADLEGLSVGIVPKENQKELRATFHLPASIEDSLSLALGVSESKIDLLYCNEHLVLQEVLIGDAPPLNIFESSLEKQSIFQRIKLFGRTMIKVHDLKHTQIKLIHNDNHEVKLSAVGIVALQYRNTTFASKLVENSLKASEGRLNMVILSPISVLQYMGYLFKSLVSHLRHIALPKSVGVIQSAKVKIESKKPLSVVIDTHNGLQTPVELRCKKQALALSVGEGFWLEQTPSTSSKDRIKIDHLPKDEESSSYLSKAIPFFSHASQAQYASLFSNLREESILTNTFMNLLMLATMIATFGLFINSGSVIIGAMLLAPLMQPIVSLSMGVLRQDISLQLNGFRTIGVGVLAVLFTSATIALFTPIEQLTSEMSGRLSPTILDLFVAIVSGIAAAYAKSNEKILGSLAGVSIAVALVPPIAVAGIGLGWGEWQMFSTAFLLFVTNLVGIVFASAFTFALLGYSPLHLAKKGILIWLLIVAVISIPLYNSFGQMKEDIRIQKMLENVAFSLDKQDIKLRKVEVLHHQGKEELRCEVISSGFLSQKEKNTLKEAIVKSIGRKLEIIVTFRYKL